jgi:hypothetical protein
LPPWNERVVELRNSKASFADLPRGKVSMDGAVALREASVQSSTCYAFEEMVSVIKVTINCQPASIFRPGFQVATYPGLDYSAKEQLRRACGAYLMSSI